MASRNVAPSDNDSPVATEALQWLVRRMDRATWTDSDEHALKAWRAAKAEHEREFRRNELAADLLSQPQAHRSEIRYFKKQAEIGAACSVSAKGVGDPFPRLQDAIFYLERARAAGTTPQSAIRLMDEAIFQLRSCTQPTDRLLLARALIQRANFKRDRGIASEASGVFGDYDEAEKHLLTLIAGANPAWREDFSALCLDRGLAFLLIGLPDALSEAVRCFDRAIEIARPLVAKGCLWDRCRLMTAWMNRGDALFRLNKPAQLTEALRCYDEAFALVEAELVLEQPVFRRRYVVACLNRAGIFLARNATGDAQSALDCSDAAISVLEKSDAEDPDAKILLGSAWANCAAAFSRMTPTQGGMGCVVSSQTAVKIVRDWERSDLRAAQASLTARHALCVGTAKLVATEIAADIRERFVSATLTAVNEGLALARHWEQRGLRQFHWLATELMTFGGRLSETYQPHLLGEFFLSHLDPTRTPEKIAWRPEVRASAIGLLDEAIQRLLSERIAASANGRLSDYYLDSLNALCAGVDRLKKLDAGAGA